MIDAKVSKKDGYAQASIQGVNALECAEEIGNLMRAVTRAFLKPVNPDNQKEFAEILKAAVVAGYREALKEVMHETVD